MAPRITLSHEQFAELYAQQVGQRLEDLVRGGMSCMPCGCGATYCLGWRAYWERTGRESHGDPKKMIESINRQRDAQYRARH